MLISNVRRSYFYKNLLELVDTEWDRAKAAKERLDAPCSSERGPGLHYGGVRGCRRLLVALLSARVLLLSAKHLILAAKQLFLAAKHAVACMSLPRGLFSGNCGLGNPATPSGP